MISDIQQSAINVLC